MRNSTVMRKLRRILARDGDVDGEFFWWDF